MTKKNTWTGLEVAVIGMAGRFPGARNIETFWDNLNKGMESITFLSDRELEEAGLSAALVKNPGFVRSNGGVLENIEYFDAAFFDYTPMEAEQMAPPIRIFHECLWEALEDAAYNPAAFDRFIGLYAGASSGFNWELLANFSPANKDLNPFVSSYLSSKDYISSLMSYKFNLKGPVFSMHTACSTSLVAIHLACQGLLASDCDMALAGGIGLRLQKEGGYFYAEGMIFSPDGHCRAFDANAGGTACGDGIGIVVLKRLEDAIRDRDNIYAVIIGSAINNDGDRKVGFTAPGIEGQVEVIRKALRMAEVNPADISYVETHGTGTLLGDVTEIEALKIAFNTTKKQSCALGSVKTNVGHLDTAAGVTGLIKTILALKYKQIPPSLHFQEPNPKIDFENSPFYVNTTNKPWESNGTPLRAGVSAFGIGGTNAHIVLEEALAVSKSVNQWVSESVGQRLNGQLTEGRGGSPCPPLKWRDYQLILLSAKTQSALEKMTINLVNFLKENRGNPANPVHPGQNPGPVLADAAYTLQVGRRRFPYRRKLVCSDVSEAIDGLSNLDPRKVQTYLVKDEKKPVIFMFSGLGSQYVNMGRDLYEKESIFRGEMDRCFEILNGHTDFNIKEILYPGRGEVSSPTGKSPATCNLHLLPGINHIEIAQLVVFIFEYSLARLLMSWGIKPRAMVGYSFGEYVAACLSGVFSLKDALKLLVTRGKLIRELPPGMMLSVPLSKKELLPLLEGNDPLSISIENGASCVISGPVPAVESFEKQMKERKLLCMPLDSSHAIHSQMMQPILERLEKATAAITLNPPRIPYISTISGNWITVEDAVSPRYWARQLRETVCFSRGIQCLCREPDALFLEVGAGRDICALVQREIPDKFAHQVVNLVKHRHGKKEIPDTYYLLDKIGLLWLYGVSIDGKKFYSAEKRYRISLPTYPFEGHRFWQLVDDYKAGNISFFPGKQKSGKSPGVADCFYVPTWKYQRILNTNIQDLENGLCWWIFTDETGLGEGLAEQVKQHKNQRVIRIKPGPGFVQHSHFDYEINPRQYEDYEKLVVTLNSMGINPNRIIHLWNVTPQDREGIEPEFIRETLDFGFFSLLYLLKVIGRQGKYSGEIEINVITNHMQQVTGNENLHPGKAAVQGPCRVIPQEYPGITCKSIDIIDGLNKKNIRLLLQEIMLPIEESVVAYRGNRRWVQVFDPVRLQESETSPLLREGGVYLIIGGLGDIGSTLAEYLSKRVGAKVILTGRTQLPEPEMWSQYLIIGDKDDKIYQYIRKLQQLRELGGEVLYFPADTADPRQMQEALRQGEKRMGPINGVIHSAGIIAGDSFNTIADIAEEACHRQFRSKMSGLLVLEKLLTGKNLDFCLIISSISTVLGGLGFGAYSAANHFTDTFSMKHNQKTPVPWIIVDWDGTNKEDTSGAFHRIFSTDSLEQIIFSVGGDLEGRISRWVKLEDMHKEEKGKQGGSTPLYSRPEMSNPYEAPRNALEKRLADIWQHFFGIEKIGVNDDLFDLGGDSLKAINIISIIQKELKVTIPIKQFFDFSTIEGVANYIAGAEKREFISIEPAEKKEYYILSSAQKRLYVLQEMEKDSIAYNSPQVIRMEGSIEWEQLRQAVGKMTHRHESLRTSIRMVESEPVQKVHQTADLELPFEYDDIATVSSIPGEMNTVPAREKPGTNARVEMMIRDFIRPFDLAQTPCFRLRLVDVGENHYILMFDIHHIITDGISHEIFVKELMTFYTGKELPSLPIQYKDYSQWQNSPQHQTLLAQQQAYWLARFQTGSDIPVLVLPYDYPRPVLQSFAGDIITFQLPDEETRALRKIAASQGVTLYMVLMTIFNVFLFELSRQEDIVVGTPVMGRRHVELESIIGVFINTLPVRNYPSADKTLHSFLQEVKETTLQAFDHQDYQFEDLVDKVVVRRDTSRNPLFDALFVLQVSQSQVTGPGVPQIELPGLKLKPREYKANYTAKFDLTLDMIESGDQLLMHFEYCTRLFKKETLQRFIQYFKRISTAMIDNLQQHISDIDILSEEEKQQLLKAFNQAGAVYPRDKTLHQLFTERVDRVPDHAAVVGNHQGTRGLAPLSVSGAFTYRELNEKSDQLAYLLQEKGVQPDAIVGVMAERSVETVIGILSILKAGGAYLPIDPFYPEERITYMLKDSGAEILLKDNYLTPKVSNICPKGTSSHLHLSPVPVTSLAYVIYTSGTTGRPKGTLIQHHNVVQLIASEPFRFDFNSRDVWTLFHSFCFDFSVWEMYGALLSGGKLIVVDRNTTMDPAVFLKQLKKEQVTILNQTPPAFYNLSHQELKTPGKELSLRYVIFGGEALQPARLKEWWERYPGTPIINMFGITETTVHVTFKEISRHEIRTNVSNIGTPLPPLMVYVMDQEKALVPMGVPGECFVGGPGVGRGYLNRPRLTAEKFIANPYKPGEALYRSGDLVRLIQGQEMEYLGRIDQQVKIRGFRIELGEIEAQLLTHDAVKQAVVINHKSETGEKHLYAFIVPDTPVSSSPAGSINLNTGELRTQLSQYLPDYMIPSYFLQIKKIPLTFNGKVDRNALLSSKVVPTRGENKFMPLENDMERQIATAWQEVLKCERIGKNDNFFDLGGNSLNVIHIISKLKEEFKMDIPVVSMFEYPTVGAFSQYLLREKGTGNIPVREQLEPAVTGMREPNADTLSAAKIRRQKQKASRGIRSAND
ncbi:amino acid adenylation domain-containing protein [Acidobacteriota bacterium]